MSTSANNLFVKTVGLSKNVTMNGAQDITAEKPENQHPLTDWSARPRIQLTSKLSGWTAGHGPSLLLLHGVGLNADAWAAQVDTLSADYQTIAIDMPGHGESDRLQHADNLANYSDCIVEVINALDSPVFLVGHSMGALIALDIAIRYPQKLAKLVAMNAIFQRSEAALRAVQQRARELSGINNPDPTNTLQRWFADKQDLPAALACRRWLETVDPEGYRQAYQVFANERGPLAERLGRLSVPALFLTGAEEPNSTPEMSRAMAELTPNGQAVVIEGAAHMMPMTHAAAVNKVILDFFAGET